MNPPADHPPSSPSDNTLHKSAKGGGRVHSGEVGDLFITSEAAAGAKYLAWMPRGEKDLQSASWNGVTKDRSDEF